MNARKRLLLLSIAALLTAAAALAIGILLFGDFGATEGQILATTALLAGYGLLALPATILRDQKRLVGLAAGSFVLVAVAASLAVAAVWSGDDPEALGKAFGTATVWAFASAQVCALCAWRRRPGSRLLRLLFALSSGLAVAAATAVTAWIWAEIDEEPYGRAVGVLVVLDVLTVALQPILSRARPSAAAYRLRLVVEPGETVELTVDAADLASAAATAIRALERDGRSVVRIELADGPTGSDGGQAPSSAGKPKAGMRVG